MLLLLFFSKIINAGGVFDKSHAHITLEEKKKTNFVTSVWWRIGGIRPHQKNVFFSAADLFAAPNMLPA